MKAAKPTGYKEPASGPISRSMGSADSAQQSRQSSGPGLARTSVQSSVQNSVQGSVQEFQTHSGMTDFAVKFFRYDRRMITIVVDIVQMVWINVTHHG